MKFIIMANGADAAWGNYRNTPKQLLEVKGETLLQRTVRLIQDYDPESTIVITGKNASLETEGAHLYRPLEDSFEIDRFTYELIENDTCFLCGDTYYTRAAIRKIATIRTDDLLFFGSRKRIFALKINDADLAKAHIDKVKNLYAEDALDECGDWQLYQSFSALSFGKRIVAENFIVLTDSTQDFNTPADYQQFNKILKQKKVAIKRKKKEKKRQRNREKTREFFLKVLAFRLVLQGFSQIQALEWTHRVYADLTKNKSATLHEKRQAYRRGYLPSQVKRLGAAQIKSGNLISEKDYRYIMPINGTYNKWLNNFILRKHVFAPFAQYFAECYYQIGNRDGQRQFIPLPDCPEGYGENAENVLQLIKDKGGVVIRRMSGKAYGKTYEMFYDGDICRINNRTTSTQDLQDFLTFRKSGVLRIFEHLESSSDHIINVQLIVLNETGKTPLISDAFVLCKQPQDIGSPSKEFSSRKTRLIRFDADTGQYPYEGLAKTIPHYQKMKKTIRQLCLFTPEIEFMGITLVVVEGGFKIIRLTANPEYKDSYTFSELSTSYLLAKLEEKKKSRKGFGKKLGHISHRIALRIRRRFTRMLFPPGLFPYLGVRWISLVTNDFWTNKDATLKEKLWAYKNGFLSYRIKQYGITKQNRTNYIADLEYLWLRHINTKSRIGLEDKITVKYILPDYKKYFPDYYFHIVNKHGQNRIIPMMDCPKGYSGKLEDIFELVGEKKVLALKPDEGSHGEGFFKFSHVNNKYYLNSDEVSKGQVAALLKDIENQYLVTEYIQMHPDLKRIYDGAVNTIRMIVFKKDGKTPEIGNAYMRIGSSRTGVVDNMSAGGMYAQIDIDTGRYYNAKSIENNQILPCEYHPDTGATIEGHLPNWEVTKQLVLDMAQAVPFLEYFGFDIAITEEGIKLPEINRFPDYPKIEVFSTKTIEYLLYKLERKKVKYKYHIKRPMRLFNLPDRPWLEEPQETSYSDEPEYEAREEAEEEQLEYSDQ
ncbi:MAG: hypothetical protein FWG24_02360 [Eggerthellaceae bacterium]|nr:hypothetical protein [Eggerthellaceae bacterium]